MQTSEHPTTALDLALMALRHHRLVLEPTHPFRGRTEVTGFWPAGRDTHPDPDIAAAFGGRAALQFEAGAFKLDLDPTVAELRALAALCTAMADEREAIAARLANTAADAADTDAAGALEPA